jgi:hypothetical protein
MHQQSYGYALWLFENKNKIKSQPENYRTGIYFGGCIVQVGGTG